MARSKKAPGPKKADEGDLYQGADAVLKCKIVAREKDWLRIEVMGESIYANVANIHDEEGALVVADCQADPPENMRAQPQPGERALVVGHIQANGVSLDGLEVQLPSWIIVEAAGYQVFAHRKHVHWDEEEEVWLVYDGFLEPPARDELPEG